MIETMISLLNARALSFHLLGTINVDTMEDLEKDMNDTIAYIEEQDTKLKEFEKLCEDYAVYQEKLDMEVTEYQRLADTRADLNMKKDLWFGTKKFNDSIMDWKKCKLMELNMEDMTADIKHFIKLVGKVGRYLCPNADQEHQVVEYLKSNVFELKKIMPIIEHLSSEALKERHWAELAETLQYDIKVNDAGFTLGTIFEKDLLKFEKEITSVAVKAAQEMALIELLDKVVEMWKECDMPLKEYKDYKNCYILGDLADIVANLDESLVTIQTINSSRYVDPIKEEVAEWNKKLVLFQDTLDEWVTMQKKWMYLETIFSGGDIAKQLPAEVCPFPAAMRSCNSGLLTTYQSF